MRSALAAGRECAASKALGIIAHLLADVAQPMHTDGRPAEDDVHRPYESAVDARSEPSDDVYAFRFDGVDRTEPYRRTVRIAERAHRSYDDLVRIFEGHGYNDRVGRITERQLNRAANGLADLISHSRDGCTQSDQADATGGSTARSEAGSSTTSGGSVGSHPAPSPCHHQPHTLSLPPRDGRRERPT